MLVLFPLCSKPCLIFCNACSFRILMRPYCERDYCGHEDLLLYLKISPLESIITKNETSLGLLGKNLKMSVGIQEKVYGKPLKNSIFLLQHPCNNSRESYNALVSFSKRVLMLYFLIKGDLE